MLCVRAVCIASMAKDINLSHTVTLQNIYHGHAQSILTIDFLFKMEKTIFTLGSIIILEKKDKNKYITNFCVSDVWKTFWFYFCSNVFTGLKYTGP